MSLTPTELEKAKFQASLISMTPADRELRMKYPKLTLEAARLVDATEVRCPSCGHVSGFERLLWQENGIHLNGDHT